MKSFHRSCHALRASPHLTACPAVSTEVSPSDSLFSSRPAWSLGYVYVPAMVGIALTSMFFARFGARLAHRLPPRLLKRLFALLLLSVGLSFLV